MEAGLSCGQDKVPNPESWVDTDSSVDMGSGARVRVQAEVVVVRAQQVSGVWLVGVKNSTGEDSLERCLPDVIPLL